ncbi:hypothetical protein METHP14_420001 [Pseudomonas sp. P14-2025]
MQVGVLSLWAKKLDLRESLRERGRPLSRPDGIRPFPVRVISFPSQPSAPPETFRCSTPPISTLAS